MFCCEFTFFKALNSQTLVCVCVCVGGGGGGGGYGVCDEGGGEVCEDSF